MTAKRNLVSRVLSLAAAMVLLAGICLMAGCSLEETAYSGSVKYGNRVYADLISIEPMTKVGSSYLGTAYNYTDTVCVGYTTTGDEVWVYLSIEKYKELFDATANFEGDEWWADKVSFSEPVRVHGKMDRAESLCQGLSEDTGHDLILVFSSKD